MRYFYKTILVTFFLLLLTGSCIKQHRTRQFILDSEYSHNKIEISGWLFLPPELESFYKQAGISKIPGIDTTLFTPFIKIKKPKILPQSTYNVLIDSIQIVFLNSSEIFTRYPTYIDPFFLHDIDTSEYKYFYFGKNNSLNIPNRIDSILFKFEATIINSIGETVISKEFIFRMVRQEKKGYTLSYGD